MITIVDYGLGNIQAFINLYKRLGIPVAVAKTAEALGGVTKLILPGVGAFDHAMEKLNQSGMRETMDRLVLQEEIPVLGICVGMQMLANFSEEGELPGLGWIDGVVRRFDVTKLPHFTHLPHMGWNDVKVITDHPLLHMPDSEARFYFLHSYYFECNQSENTLATADYGESFTCAVHNKNVYGVQFHPEKSHHFGAQLLANFANL